MTLYISQLPEGVQQEQIFALFLKFGKVIGCALHEDSAEIIFERSEDAMRAQRELNETIQFNRHVMVELVNIQASHNISKNSSQAIQQSYSSNNYELFCNDNKRSKWIEDDIILNKSDLLSFSLAESLQLTKETPQSQINIIQRNEMAELPIPHNQMEYNYYINQLNSIVVCVKENGIQLYHKIQSQLVHILIWALNQPQQFSQPIQERVCKTICKCLKGQSFSQFPEMNMKLVSQLMILINEVLPINSLKPIHIKALSLIYQFSTDQQKQTIFIYGITQTASKVLRCVKTEVIEMIISLIHNIIYDGLQTYSNHNFHPFSSVLIHDIGKPLFESGIMKDQTEITKFLAAISFGWIYKGIELPIQYKREIISILMKGLINKDKFVSTNCLSAIISLSQCQANHSVILLKEFNIDLQQLLKNNENNKYKAILILLIKLLQNGDKQIIQSINNLNISEFIQKLSQNENMKIQELCKKVQSWIHYYENMKQVFVIEQQIKLIKENEKNKFNKQKEFNIICEMLHCYLKEENEYCGVMLYACEVASRMISDNKIFIDILFEDDQFIDILVNFLITLPYSQILGSYLLPICVIINYISPKQCSYLFDKGLVDSLSKFLTSSNETILDRVTYIIYKMFQLNFNEMCQGLQNPYYFNMKSCNTHQMLFDLLCRTEFNNQNIKQQASLALGYFYKSSPLPYQNSSVVISNLQSIALCEIEDLSIEAFQALGYLAENKNNHNDILNEEFNDSIIFMMKWRGIEYLKAINKLLTIIYDCGSKETKEFIVDNFSQFSTDNVNFIVIQKTLKNMNKIQIQNPLSLNDNQLKLDKIKKEQQIIEDIVIKEMEKKGLEFDINTTIKSKFDDLVKDAINICSVNKRQNRNMNQQLFQQIDYIIEQLLAITLKQESFQSLKPIDIKSGKDINFFVNEDKKLLKTQIHKDIDIVMQFFGRDVIWCKELAMMMKNSRISDYIIEQTLIYSKNFFQLHNFNSLFSLILWSDDEGRLILYRKGAFDVLKQILLNNHENTGNQSTYLINCIIHSLKQTESYTELSHLTISLLTHIKDDSTNNDKFIQYIYNLNLLILSETAIKLAPQSAKYNLYFMEYVQILIEMIDKYKQNLSNALQFDFDIKQKRFNLKSDIIYNQILMIALEIVNAGADYSEQGQQHPWFIVLECDGTIDKLLLLIDQKQMSFKISIILGFLHKAIKLNSIHDYQIISEIMGGIILNQQLNMIEYGFKALCYLAECEQNHNSIVNHKDFIQIIKFPTIQTDGKAYIQFLQFIETLSHFESDETKQKILKNISTSILTHIPSLSNFHHQLMKNDNMLEFPSALVIDFATQKGIFELIDKSQHEIESFFIQILALIDFFHRFTTEKQTLQNYQQKISPWLEMRLLILAHSLINQLQKYKMNDEQNINNNLLMNQFAIFRYCLFSYFGQILIIMFRSLEHCEVMNAVTLIENLLKISNENQNENENDKNRISLLNFISIIKEYEIKGKNIKIKDLLNYKSVEKEKKFNLNENQIIKDFEIVQILENKSEIHISLITPNQEDKQFVSSSSHSQSQYSISSHSQIYQLNSVFLIDKDFNMLNPLTPWEQNKLEDQNKQIIVEQIELQQEEQIVETFEDILFNQLLRNSYDITQLDWACESAIPWLGNIIQRLICRYQSQQSTFQLMNSEKHSLFILAYIAEKGIINNNNKFKALFDIVGLSALIEKFTANLESYNDKIYNYQQEQSSIQIMINKNREIRDCQQQEQEQEGFFGSDYQYLLIFMRMLYSFIIFNPKVKEQLNIFDSISIFRLKKEEIDNYLNINDINRLDELHQNLNEYIIQYKQINNNQQMKIFEDNKIENINKEYILKTDELLITIQMIFSSIKVYIQNPQFFSIIPEYLMDKNATILSQLIHINCQYKNSIIAPNIDYTFLIQYQLMQTFNYLLNNKKLNKDNTFTKDLISHINLNLISLSHYPQNHFQFLLGFESIRFLIASIKCGYFQDFHLIQILNLKESLFTIYRRRIIEDELCQSTNFSSEMLWNLCCTTLQFKQAGTVINKAIFFIHSGFSQILSQWICICGVEVNINQKIKDTIQKIIDLHQYLKMMDINEGRERLIIEQESQMEEEGISEEIESIIFSKERGMKDSGREYKNEVLKYFVSNRRMH